MHGTCNWCLAVVKAPKDYNRRTMRLYCSEDCAEKDWLFMRWQNDDYLNYIAWRRRNETQKGNHPPPQGKT